MCITLNNSNLKYAIDIQIITIRCLHITYELQRTPIECLTNKEKQNVYRVECCDRDFCNQNELLKLEFVRGINKLIYFKFSTQFLLQPIYYITQLINIQLKIFRFFVYKQFQNTVNFLFLFYYMRFFIFCLLATLFEYWFLFNFFFYNLVWPFFLYIVVYYNLFRMR